MGQGDKKQIGRLIRMSYYIVRKKIHGKRKNVNLGKKRVREIIIWQRIGKHLYEVNSERPLDLHVATRSRRKKGRRE